MVDGPMHTDRFVAALAAAALFVACNGKLFSVTLEESSEIVVERGTPLEVLLGDFGFDEFTDLEIRDDTRLENQGVAPGDISDVYFTSFVLTAASPSGADLSFIDTLAFYVEADGLPRQRIAFQDSFPAGQATVELELDGVDLTEYVVAPSMDLTTEVSGGRPDVDTTVRADFALKVGATRQGLCNAARQER